MWESFFPHSFAFHLHNFFIYLEETKLFGFLFRQDQQEKTFAQADGNAPDSIIHEEDETFLGLDDVLGDYNFYQMCFFCSKFVISPVA